MRFSAKVVLAAALVAAPAAQAVDVDVLAGVSSSIRHTLTDAEFVDVSGDTREWGAVHWQPMASLGHVGTRSNHYGNLDHNVWVGAAGVRLVDWWRGAFFAFQLGYADPLTDALSSHAQFVSSLGWQGDRYEVMLRHISNGHIFSGRNLGETMLMVGLRF